MTGSRRRACCTYLAREKGRGRYAALVSCEIRRSELSFEPPPAERSGCWGKDSHKATSRVPSLSTVRRLLLSVYAASRTDKKWLYCNEDQAARFREHVMFMNFAASAESIPFLGESAIVVKIVWSATRTKTRSSRRSLH